MTADNYAASRVGSRKRTLALSSLLFIAGLFIGCDQPADPTHPLGVAHRAPAAISDPAAQREAQMERTMEMPSAPPAPSGPPEGERHDSNGDDILVRVRR